MIRKTSAPMPEKWALKPIEGIYKGISDVTIDGPWQAAARDVMVASLEIGKGQFEFLNQTETHRGCQTWNDPSLSQLWRYHLHYFNYITDLAVLNASQKGQSGFYIFRKLVLDWIECNRVMKGDGWHPYTLSLRLVNWVEALTLFQKNLKNDPDFTSLLISSIYGQARFLFYNLEFDVRGNHLLKNLRALIWCGQAFQGAEPELWLSRAMHLLEQEIAEQVLPDGGHFERVPGYHALVLQDCLEIGWFLRLNGGGKTIPWLDNALERMLRYLMAIVPHDGNLPLIKDTARDAALLPSELLAAGAVYFKQQDYITKGFFGIYPLLLFGIQGYDLFQSWALKTVHFLPTDPQDVQTNSGAELKETSHGLTSQARLITLSESGYYVLGNDSSGDYMIFDAGKVCPDYLPAHAHADLFSYELLMHGKRIVVDSGVYEYASGKWRDFFRSTRAHNTIEIEGTNQSEVWSSFRVARRARPFGVTSQIGDNFILVQGRHDGYKRLKVPVIHRRIIVWEIGKFRVIVDELQGTGNTEVSGFIHLNPEILPEQRSKSTWELTGLPFPLWLKMTPVDRVSLVRGQIVPEIQGWYSEKFGLKVPNPVIGMHKKARLPFLMGYLLSSNKDDTLEWSSEHLGHYEVLVKDNNGILYKLHINPAHVSYEA